MAEGKGAEKEIGSPCGLIPPKARQWDEGNWYPQPLEFLPELLSCCSL